MEESIVGDYDGYDEEIIHLYSLDKETKPCNEDSCEIINEILGVNPVHNFRYWYRKIKDKKDAIKSMKMHKRNLESELQHVKNKIAACEEDILNAEASLKLDEIEISKFKISGQETK